MLKISPKGDCIRNTANYTKQSVSDKFDKGKVNVEDFANNMAIKSPKLIELLSNIKRLDDQDMKQFGKTFKHVIYTDLKKSSSGSKMIAVGLMTNGFSNVYDDKFRIIQNFEKNTSNNFALLSSVAIYDKPFPIKLKKNILSIFNQRPDNVQGELIRFIILDQGFKEGIDLFDVKYVHLFEPLITESDQKQAVGRGTRYCGQKGLEFDSKKGWQLHVYRYDIQFDEDLMKKYNASTISELFIQNSGLDLRKLKFASELEVISKYGAIDYELTENVHKYTLDNNSSYESDISSSSIPNAIGNSIEIVKGSVDSYKKSLDEYLKYRELKLGAGIKGKKKKGQNVFLAKAISKKKSFLKTREYIRERFNKYKWDKIVFENNCVQKPEDADKVPSRIVEYTPTQDFVSKFFNNTSASKGLLLWHSVGTGKTCSAIAVASTGFEPHGYTILWVTRHTLKSEIWKNIFKSVCSAVIRRRILNGENIPEDVQRNPMKYLSKNWILPISYKQFTNMLNKKNEIYKEMVKRNGVTDPLKKTLVIIDEVHKLYSADLPASERPNLNTLKENIQNSYKISGENSVRLLLMTATPYTSNPMDLIKIVNLMKDSKDHMPETFEDFEKEYLGDDTLFTDDGAKKYLDNITPYISYLNREKDIRQFAYPVFYNVYAKLSRKSTEDSKYLEELIKKREDLEKLPLTNLTKAEQKSITSEIKSIQKLEKKLKTKIKNDKDDISQEAYLDKCISQKK